MSDATRRSTDQIDLAREAVFALGAMTVSPASCELLFDGHAEMLQPRVMQVLVALARRRNEVVLRDELVDLCWGGRVVSEDAISRCIQAIRRRAETVGGFSITTIARVGYRLVEASSAGADATSRELPATAAERRRLTVLACNLVHSRAARADPDPEAWRAIGQRYREVVSEAVNALGGHVVRGLGDNLNAYFGYPDATEDAAERAVRAGLTIVESVKTWAQSANVAGTVAVRVGVHAGAVVITRQASEIELFGEAPDVATLIQAIAEPDTVAVTETVRALVSDLFVTEERRAELPRGADGPTRFYRVVAAVADTRRSRGFSAREITPFVGREDETQLLLGRWRRVQRGEGQLVLLTGEPGIGKTRLTEEFRARIGADAHLWIEGAGERLNSNTPFHAVARMLDQGLAARADASPGERVAALERALDGSGLDLAEAVPLVAELLNVRIPASYPPLDYPPERKRNRLLACLTAWVFSLARSQPLVIAMDDLHWADPSTMELLETLVEQGGAGALLLLCTARTEFRPSWPMRAHHARLVLDRLSPDETRALVESVVAEAGLSADVIDTVIERTDGVPLFAEELTRLILEGRADASARAIPTTLHDSLAARLDRLGPAKAIAQLAAVLGGAFPYALVSAVSPMPAEELDAALAKLADAELIFARGRPPEASYQFKHALILDVAYDALLKEQRRELHALIARTIGQRFPALAEAQPEVLARHWSEAGEADKAVTAWTAAAGASAARHAYREAIEGYRNALEMLAALPEAPERDVREMELLVSLSDIIGATRGYPSDEYVALSERLTSLAETMGSLPQLVMQTLVRCVSAFTAGERATVVGLAGPLLDLARREGSDMSLRLAHMVQVFVLNGGGDLAAVEEHYAIWRDIVERSGYGRFLGETAVVFAAAFENAFLLGQLDEAQRRVALAMSVAVETQSPFEIAMALMMESWLCVLEKEPRGAESAALKALAIAEEHRFTQINQIRSCLAWARAHLGDPAEGVRLAESSLPGWVGGGFPRLIEARRVLAQAQALSGAAAEALAALDDICNTPTDNPVLLAAHLVCRAEVRLRLGQTGPAADDLQQAISFARERQARSVELRAATLLARLLCARGQTAAARDLLAPAYGWFTTTLDTADLRDAKTLLDELG